jgi:RNA polymerase sigma-70 factor (ECF subfamily)
VTDTELLRAAQAGNGTAVQTLYERYLPLVWRYVYAQVDGDSHAAQDLVSETFLAAVGALATLNAESTIVTGWLLGIARHKIADRHRAVRLSERAQRVVVDLSEARPAEPESAMRLQAAELRAQVTAALDSLTDDERLVLEAKYLDDLTVRQIAGRMGRTEKAVEALLYRARQAFRSRLGAAVGEGDS